MNVHRTLLGTMLAFGLLVTAQSASAPELLGPHGNGAWLGAPVFVGSGYHGDGHRHHRGRLDQWNHGRHGHRRGPGKGYLTLHTTEHRHDGLGWHVHQEWRRQRHPAPQRHGSRRNDDWEDGAGIALGVLTGMLLFNQFDSAGDAGRAGPYSPVLDARSRQRQEQAIRSVLDSGGNSVRVWKNPANRSGSASGEVRITRNGRDDFGNPCREYHQTVRVGSRTEQGHRTVCRDRNGNWHLQ